MKKIIFKISGMSCQHCVKAVSEALQAVEGVHTVSVSLENEQAVIQYDEVIFDSRTAKAAVLDQGYEVIGVVE